MIRSDYTVRPSISGQCEESRSTAKLEDQGGLPVYVRYPDSRPGSLSGIWNMGIPAWRRYYDRKRTEGKTHIQSMLSLARRRLNVIWAMLRNGTAYPPAAAQIAP